MNQIISSGNSQIKLLAVALAKTAPSDALLEAQEKGCEYIVSVQVSYPPRFAQNESPQPGNLRELNQPALPGPQLQSVRIIGYQLHKVSDDCAVSQQTYPSPLTPPESTAMQLVNSVYHATARAVP